MAPTPGAGRRAGERGKSALCRGSDRTRRPDVRLNRMALQEHDPHVSVYAMAEIYIIGGFAMSDDKTRTGGQDRKRVSLSDDYEVRDWSEKFGVSAERLRAAVGKVGNMAEDVERELKSG